MRESVWQNSAPVFNRPPLEGNHQFDVVVIGGGICGLTTALRLKRSGKRVAVVEKGSVGSGETGRTSAHLTEILDPPYGELKKHFGVDGARQAFEASAWALNRIRQTVIDEKIDCALRAVPGYLYTQRSEDLDVMEQRFEEWKALNLPVERVSELPLPFRVRMALRLEDQAQFHPLEYLYGLAERVQGDDSVIYENSPVREIHDGEPCRVETDGGAVVAPEVVVATHVPISSRYLIHTKLEANRSYVIGATLSGVEEAPGLFWDVCDPYHYMRLQIIQGERVITLGGEDHRTGSDEMTLTTRFRRLEEHLRARFDIREIKFRWSGQIIETVDGLPYIGKSPHSEHLYIATGFSGTGLTWGTLAAHLMADEILKIPNSYQELFRARRVKPDTVLKYLQQNKEFPIALIKDRLALSPTLRQIPNGEGKVVEVEGKRLAVYRDDRGEIHALNPVCPHLGCLVRFNDVEKSWDCPCHGSRFDIQGRVLNGPTLEGLAPAVPGRQRRSS